MSNLDLSDKEHIDGRPGSPSFPFCSPYSISEVKLVLSKQITNIYHKEIFKWLIDEYEKTSIELEDLKKKVSENSSHG